MFRILHSFLHLETVSLFIAHPFHDVIEVTYSSDWSTKILHIHLCPYIKVSATWIEDRIVVGTVSDKKFVISIRDSKE
jgi:hypothetical protein